MAQDLLKITPEALQLQLPNLSFTLLKQLYMELYQYMRNCGNKIDDATLIQIQRKLSKLQGEMNSRSKLDKDFQIWERKLMRDLRRG